MKKSLKVICMVVACLVLLAGAWAGYTFLIGEPVDGNTLICHVQEEENRLHIQVSTPSSGIAFRDHARIRREGSELHITLRKVLVSPIHPTGQWSQSVETEGITRVYLGGKQIWPQ